MTNDNIKSFARETDNGQMMTPRETLEDVIASIGVAGALQKGTKVIVMCLDDTEGGYTTTWFQGGMTMSECVSLCEVTKTRFLEEMGY